MSALTRHRTQPDNHQLVILQTLSLDSPCLSLAMNERWFVIRETAIRNVDFPLEWEEVRSWG